MKTKEKEIQKKIKELCELMGYDDKFFFFRKKGSVAWYENDIGQDKGL